MDKNKAGLFERHLVVTMAIIVIFSILILDLTAAQAYKLIFGYPWGMRGIVQTKRVERLYRTASPIYHHALSVNKSVDSAQWGHVEFTVRTNSLGFKDRTVRDIPLVSDRYRIVFIGDSFTEGSGVNYEDTFVGLIDEALSKKGIEVLNASASSYCPIIYWRKTKYLIEDAGLKFDSLVVYLDISDPYDEGYYYEDKNGNIFCTVPEEVEGGKIYEELPPFKKIIKYNTILLYTLLDRINDILFPNKYKLDFKKSTWTFDKDAYNRYGEKGLRKMELYMDRLYGLLERHKIKLIVAVYPWPDQIVRGDLGSIHVSFWQNWCEAHKVPFIDYFPSFITGHTREEREKTLDDYFIRGDVHWNKKGHRLMADIFLDFYEGRAATTGSATK